MRALKLASFAAAAVCTVSLSACGGGAAPANAAFEKIPSATLNGVLNDNDQLTKVLTYHVVPGRLSPDQLAGTHKTLEGQDLTVAGSGTAFTVNGNSSVVCGNVQTENATVYIVDTVLMPKG